MALSATFNNFFTPLNDAKIGTYTEQTKWNIIAFLGIVPIFNRDLPVNKECAMANTSTVIYDETEWSLNDDYILPVCAIALQFFSVCDYVSLDAYYKIALT